MNAIISQLAIYPLKSAAAIAVQQSVLSNFGLQWDRRWLVIDNESVFVTQRQCPQIALINVSVIDNVLHLSAPNMLPHIVTPHHPQEVSVTIWHETVMALTVSQEADTWLSQFLGFSVRLVFFPDYSQRVVDTAWAGVGHQTAFSDGFPLLVISQASFDDVSQRWGQAIDWRRFRPNIVIAGNFAPYSEDTWTGLTIGDVELALVKPCSRCVIPSINPQTGAKDSSLNRVLAQYRRAEDGKIYLGQNAIIKKGSLNSMLHIGDKVQVISN